MAWRLYERNQPLPKQNNSSIIIIMGMVLPTQVSAAHPGPPSIRAGVLMKQFSASLPWLSGYKSKKKTIQLSSSSLIRSAQVYKKVTFIRHQLSACAVRPRTIPPALLSVLHSLLSSQPILNPQSPHSFLLSFSKNKTCPRRGCLLPQSSINNPQSQITNPQFYVPIPFLIFF